MTIDPAGCYLTRTGRRIGIIGPCPGARKHFAWLTTAGYYVTRDGRAALRGTSAADLCQRIE